jgi:hypothetical protein
MTLAILITPVMTSGVVYILGIDLRQVSVATFIVALGLLMDLPVVSGMESKRGLATACRAALRRRFDRQNSRLRPSLPPLPTSSPIFGSNCCQTMPSVSSYPSDHDAALLLCGLVVAMTFI